MFKSYKSYNSFVFYLHIMLIKLYYYKNFNKHIVQIEQVQLHCAAMFTE